LAEYINIPNEKTLFYNVGFVLLSRSFVNSVQA